MILRLAALALLLTLVARPAAACPEATGSLLFHSCWGAARLDIALAPEDLPLPTPPDEGFRLVVTGAYTATDTRADDRPKPVGLFLRRGEVINRNLARMDGVLLLDPESDRPELQHRDRVRLGGRVHDLADLEQRRAFIAEAAERGMSVMQSHLLVDAGEADVAPLEGARTSVRRVLFTDAHGFGLWQSETALTLYDATTEIVSALDPEMAMNLDMGSYNFCRRAEAGVEINCGGLAPNGAGKLSNLLVLALE